MSEIIEELLITEAQAALDRSIGRRVKQGDTRRYRPPAVPRGPDDTPVRSVHQWTGWQDFLPEGYEAVGSGLAIGFARKLTARALANPYANRSDVRQNASSLRDAPMKRQTL